MLLVHSEKGMLWRIMKVSFTSATELFNLEKNQDT